MGQRRRPSYEFINPSPIGTEYKLITNSWVDNAILVKLKDAIRYRHPGIFLFLCPDDKVSRIVGLTKETHRVKSIEGGPSYEWYAVCWRNEDNKIVYQNELCIQEIEYDEILSINSCHNEVRDFFNKWVKQKEVK